MAFSHISDAVTVDHYGEVWPRRTACGVYDRDVGDDIGNAGPLEGLGPLRKRKYQPHQDRSVDFVHRLPKQA